MRGADVRVPGHAQLGRGDPPPPRRWRRAVGAEWYELDVDALVAGYVAAITGALGRELTLGHRRRHAPEHPGAHARAIDLDARQPARRAAADHVEPLGGRRRLRHHGRRHRRRPGPHRGIDKAFLRQWLRWGEHRRRTGSGPTPALAASTRQQPTAELRPAARRHRADRRGRPHAVPVLEAVEDAAIRDKLAPVEVLQVLRAALPDSTRGPSWRCGSSASSAVVPQPVEARALRAQRSTSTTRTSTPRPWCRFPILSGGFELELEALRAAAGAAVSAPAGPGRFVYEYPRPALTVDCVVFGVDADDLKVLLVQRKLAPFQHAWALPGGFVRLDETLDEAARRELAEETGVTDVYLEQLLDLRRARSRPTRARRHGRVLRPGPARRSQAARRADAMRRGLVRRSPSLPALAFDHREIVEAAHARLRGKVRYTPIGFELLPPRFTLTQLQRLYEQILGAPSTSATSARSCWPWTSSSRRTRWSRACGTGRRGCIASTSGATRSWRSKGWRSRCRRAVVSRRSATFSAGGGLQPAAAAPNMGARWVPVR
jgi:8-oxo-dGTP diphosphatase